MDSPDQARTAVEVLTPLVHATPASALTNPTPCDKWAVRDLLNHLVGGGYMFAAGLNGDTLDGDPNADLIGDDHVAAYDARDRGLLVCSRRRFRSLGRGDAAVRDTARGRGASHRRSRPPRARMGPRDGDRPDLRPSCGVRRVGDAVLRRVHQPSVARGRPLRSGSRRRSRRTPDRSPRRARGSSAVTLSC